MPLFVLNALFLSTLFLANPPAKTSVTTPLQTDHWKLEKDKNGIRVYSRPMPGSRRKEIKVNCELNGTMAQLVAFISDIDHYKEAVFRVEQAYLIKRINDHEFYYYNETDMPWPTSNRDLVMHMTFQMDPATHTLHIRANNVSGMVPERKGVVRIPHWRSLWTVQQITPQRMRIEYLFQVDPGGDFPIWLANTLIASGPYQSFAGMEALLKRPYYQNRTFSFLPH
ncbi:START domain-containing protein [Rudanella lutea]|uniref:START domain-containing protein n=1 Tax=Rudanella lutea TaxID=451374 RepID=UPI00036A236A|nr:START domain-containing protein [Rudanella lutea]